LKNVLGALAALLALTACSSSSSDLTVAKGLWGGQNIELQVDDTGATAQFKCGAIGQANGGLALDASGRFDVAGTYDPKLVLGGPRPARYTGSRQGDRLVLSVEVEQATIGPFDLQQGQKGTFDVCNFAQ